MSKDSGPAFPGDMMWSEAGMSLRDYFAAHAPDSEITVSHSHNNYLGEVAKKRYEWADAMLAERDKGPA